MFFPRNPNVPNRMLGKENLLTLLEANNKEATIADFDSYPMYPEDIQRLAKIIKMNTQVEVLRLYDCSLQPEDIPFLADAMQKNNTIQKIFIELFDWYSDENKKLIHEMLERAEQNHKKNPNGIKIDLG
jgi:hypothetical protein